QPSTHTFIPFHIHQYIHCIFIHYLYPSTHSTILRIYIHARHDHTSTTKVYYFIFKLSLTPSNSHVTMYPHLVNRRFIMNLPTDIIDFCRRHDWGRNARLLPSGIITGLVDRREDGDYAIALPAEWRDVLHFAGY